MSETYKGYRYPKVIIGQTGKYYHRYKLSLRDVSELMLDRGVEGLTRHCVNGTRLGDAYLPRRFVVKEGVLLRINGILMKFALRSMA